MTWMSPSRISSFSTISRTARAQSATRPLVRTLSLVLAALVLTGCVSQGQHDNLMTKDRRINEQLIELQEQLDAKEAELAALRSQLNRPVETIQDPNLLAALEKVKSERDALSGALALAEKRIQDMSGARLPVSARLPAQLDAKLKAFAAANPGLLSYDARRGMIKINSDLTFALGSIEIKQAGINALQQLAGIINSPEAMAFDIRVVGHTDNVPVKNPTNKARFGSNWGLSAFRSISVGSVLIQTGVQPTRLEVAGRGEYQPVVANGAKGAEANRRVEIFIVDSNRSVAAGEAVGNNAGVAVPERVQEENPESFK